MTEIMGSREVNTIGIYTKDLADKIYQLSEEWPGGVVFWKKARKLCIEHGAED